MSVICGWQATARESQAHATVLKVATTITVLTAAGESVDTAVADLSDAAKKTHTAAQCALDVSTHLCNDDVSHDDVSMYTAECVQTCTLAPV